MKFYNVLLALTATAFATVAIAAPEPGPAKSAASLKSDVELIDKEVANYKTTLAKKDASYEGFANVECAGSRAVLSVKKGILDATQSKDAVPDADGQAIAKARANTASSVEAISEQLIAIKPFLEKFKGGVKETHDDLVKNAAISKKFAELLASKTPASSKQAVEAADKRIQAAQAKAIEAYSK